jgi:hypothetical protein
MCVCVCVCVCVINADKPSPQDAPNSVEISVVGKGQTDDGIRACTADLKGRERHGCDLAQLEGNSALKLLCGHGGKNSVVALVHAQLGRKRERVTAC